MRPPTTPGEHLSRNIMAASHHAGSTSTGERDVVQTHQVSSTMQDAVVADASGPLFQAVSVYEVNYTQRASSVPRGVRHLESHVEVPTSPKRKISLEQHRAGMWTRSARGWSACPSNLCHIPGFFRRGFRCSHLFLSSSMCVWCHRGHRVKQLLSRFGVKQKHPESGLSFELVVKESGRVQRKLIGSNDG